MTNAPVVAGRNTSNVVVDNIYIKGKGRVPFLFVEHGHFTQEERGDFLCQM